LVVLRGYPGYQCGICARQVTGLIAKADEFAAAAEYAREGLADGEYNEFAALLCDFAAGGEQRALVATRLGQHVQRRQRREDDVAGLFDEN